jgi:hypothetical protein
MERDQGHRQVRCDCERAMWASAALDEIAERPESWVTLTAQVTVLCIVQIPRRQEPGVGCTCSLDSTLMDHGW